MIAEGMNDRMTLKAEQPLRRCGLSVYPHCSLNDLFTPMYRRQIYGGGRRCESQVKGYKQIFLISPAVSQFSGVLIKTQNSFL